MIGSSQNKCLECQEITKALGYHMSRKTLDIVAANIIRCRGGRNASVSVGFVQASSNESWSEPILLRNGMVVSFSTNFENKRRQDDNLQLSFEVTSVRIAPGDCETSLLEGRENAATNKRPLEQSSIVRLQYRVPKSSDADQRKRKPKECHLLSLRDRTPIPLPASDTGACIPPSPNASIDQNETKESNPCPFVSKSIQPDANNKTNLSVAPSKDMANTGPFKKQKNDTESNVELRIISKRTIQQAFDPTLNLVTQSSAKQLTSSSYGNVTHAMTVLQTVNSISENLNPSSGKFQPRLFFCPLGQDMSKGLIGTFSATVEKLGGIVVDKLEGSSYMVVSSSVGSWEKVAKRLGMEEKELRSLLSSKDIKAITPRWIRSIAAEGALRKPVPSETWMLVTSVRAEKRKNGDPLRDSDGKKEREFTSNLEVSKIFRELGEIYQDCPLEENDMWRAYQFRINAGRVKLLPFELTLDNLGRLRKDVTGFGASCIEIVRQYLESGEVERIHKLKTDKRRVAMRNMMEIWGVGKKAALQLINDDCSSIEDVRKRLLEKTLFLDRNQLVGVDCYEDIMQRMSRPEVVQLGGIIKTHVLKLYPGAEVTVMGSYRRGKESCGDVDVHITSNDYRTRIPPDALSSIVDSLWRDGHIAFHLTVLYGMETGYTLSDYQQAGKNLDRSVWETSKALRPPTTRREEKSHATYMGVFNSPKNVGTRRRVDLKFYPYRERVFASLYFTGNGFFNRSMRLWARQRGWQLNDTGLFERGTKKRILDATKEQQVFDILELVYKHPHERDSFDALEPKTGQVVDYEPTQGEFKEDAENQWIV
ncbi:unnamed protein product [Cylindrotheca closterium]|uniref:DNA-directed DNA polymerase X domain-containing protein n=1 Tax=Cylindrotheca closterium TaxID=2856 RepID=A0AAD2FZM8_9STRA|nr:unnamed protein product [Cylindrotheca closterium]